MTEESQKHEAKPAETPEESTPELLKPMVFTPDIRPAAEPVCCGSGCAGCPEFDS